MNEKLGEKRTGLIERLTSEGMFDVVNAARAGESIYLQQKGKVPWLVVGGKGNRELSRPLNEGQLRRLEI